MFVPDSKTRKSLAEKLRLDYDESMQDWEYEISDCNKINEFILEYGNPTLSDNERVVLMEIILSSANELLLEGRIDDFENCFGLIKDKLLLFSNLHRESIKYWSESDFEISSKLKPLL